MGLATMDARAAERRFRRLRRELREDLGDLDQVCVCTCIRNEHRHWREGTDCGRCGKAACPAFRPAVLCCCGCPRSLHQHRFSTGSECAKCGVDACPGWRPRRRRLKIIFWRKP